MLDFFNQHFLRAHGFIIRQNWFLASRIAPVVHPKNDFTPPVIRGRRLNILGDF
jgi:hypothetical protein